MVDCERVAFRGSRERPGESSIVWGLRVEETKGEERSERSRVKRRLVMRVSQGNCMKFGLRSGDERSCED